MLSSEFDEQCEEPVEKVRELIAIDSNVTLRMLAEEFCVG